MASNLIGDYVIMIKILGPSAHLGFIQGGYYGISGEEVRVMNEPSSYYFGEYSPVGDILVMVLCVVFLVVMHNSYITKTDAYSLFKKIIYLLFVTAGFSAVFHESLMRLETVPKWFVYTALALYHISYYGMFILYLFYMRFPLRLDKRATRHLIIPATVICGLGMLYEVLNPLTKWGFQITKDNDVLEGINPFPFVYILGSLAVSYLLIMYRRQIYRQIIISVITSCGVSFLLLFMQLLFYRTSYTVASFLFPTFTVLYMIHSNPYDLELGAVDSQAFEQLIKYAHDKDREMVLMSLFLPEMDAEGKQYPEEFKEKIRDFVSEFFRGATLFQVTNGRMVLAAEVAKNPSYEQVINRMLNQFDVEYEAYGYDYKIVITKTMARVAHEKDYIGLMRYAESRMDINQVHMVDNADVEDFLKHKYIVSEMLDICKKGDLNDPRVEVFCQPVLNIETKKYDTAEALMRMNFAETGRIFPDVFIPIAEEYQLIHQLSLVILNKTCQKIKEMLTEGYVIQRISVNISALELRDDNFCGDISRVIRQSGIPFGKVAIELTESQSESDFMIMKKKINELKENGIKFYLDDFGTGYSNFERIMELPFDIIKFDRSLVLATAADKKSEKMVSHLAKMFSEMNYAVLYEGVETPADEENCVRMNAKYLQGYKYSRPIPMDRLKEYFEQEYFEQEYFEQGDDPERESRENAS